MWGQEHNIEEAPPGGSGRDAICSFGVGEGKSSGVLRLGPGSRQSSSQHYPDSLPESGTVVGVCQGPVKGLEDIRPAFNCRQHPRVRKAQALRPDLAWNLSKALHLFRLLFYL